MQSNNGNVKSNTVKCKYLQCFIPSLLYSYHKTYFVKLDANFIISYTLERKCIKMIEQSPGYT